MAENDFTLGLDRDLEEVQTHIMKMGGLVEAAILASAKALEERDTELADEVRRNDKLIDELEQTVNEECARVIALRQPAAKDLRTVLTVMKISTHLERCGDYAKNLAKRTTVLVQLQPVEGAARSIRRMAREVEMMMKDALDAYIQRDAELAADVRARDQDVDQMYNALFREFLTHMMEDPRNITACMHLHFIAKNIERMGDHCTSIAEQVIYQVTGDMPDENRPKGDRTPYASVEAEK
ncbi:phosphate uptake regulator, PhoU [Tranquillimonas rosea]|uniref:Phosphate-specific transport system accessory protein PhoU n=1 Tax=Tranquillimonas rosea TaxID=641238 RepID=A0A1H9P9V9_9RHOB|nr:phosphate signaling complex protein PhoU [Tranquillimonas rosea]SER44970.1 phosphate uptake regulator, PhoU [Tranquillimonas rosea]